jgi:G3E family GTPase
LLRQAKPHRLLVEPSGLGHPAGLVDAIRGEHLKTALDLRAIICLVDPRVVAAGDELLSHPGFVNQVKLGLSANMRYAYADSTMSP